jgi:hypothetical protein
MLGRVDYAFATYPRSTPKFSRPVSLRPVMLRGRLGSMECLLILRALLAPPPQPEPTTPLQGWGRNRSEPIFAKGDAYSS